MTDMPSPDQPNGEAAPAPPSIRVLAQYVKDLSFENPGLFSAAQQGNGAPEIEVGVDVRVEPGPPQEAIFSVELRLSAKARKQDTVIFIVDLLYAGIFQVQASSREDLQKTLVIECPRLLMPFATLIIGETTRQGGHPPLILDPIDFAQVYRQQRAAEAQQAAQA